MKTKIDLGATQIHTDRLVLRPWHLADTADLFIITGNPIIEDMTGRAHHKSLQDAEGTIAGWIESKNCFAIYHITDKKVIGFLELHGSWANQDPRFEHLAITELGTAVAPQYWGQGIATEASKTTIRHCFDVLNLDGVAVCHFTTNRQSRRAIEKAGFTFMQEDEYFSHQLNRKFMEYQYILLNHRK